MIFSSTPTIAFCITCRGRTNHIERTLPQNLRDNTDYPNLKFIIVNYSSQDHLLPYLKLVHSDAIASGRLVVYSYFEPATFQMAHAKNLAHRLGMREGADILVNLDADNFTGPGFARYIAQKFQEKEIFLWAKVIPGDGLRGCSGRIVVSSQAFLKAGGYDEKYSTWSPDDKDFNIRLQRLGCSPREIDIRYLQAIKHNEKVRFREYPHAKPLVETYDQDLNLNPETTVVNGGRFGLGKIFRNFGTSLIELFPLPTRIFGIGMHKTATSSLNKALLILGYDSAHWESGAWARAIWQEMRLLGRSPTLEHHYALSDLPITLLYRELDQTYPGSKFILTLRDDKDWLESVRKHWSPTHNRFRWEWDVYPFTNRIHRQLYGQTTFDAEVFLARYRRHNEKIKDYFRNRPKDLLIMDMSQGAGWKELCGFLDNPIPALPYPQAYKTQRVEVTPCGVV